MANVPPFDRGWLKAARPSALHDSLLVIDVPDEYVRTQAETRFRPKIEALLTEHLGRPMSLAVNINPGLDAELEEDDEEEDDDVPPLSIPPTTFLTQLNPKYTFDTFVIGESNRFAHATAIAVAENPGNAFNPLLIYGDSGLGKTHLLHAIGHYVRNYYSHLRVRYVSTEELTNDFINSLTDKSQIEFRKKYRDETDVLLVDDIQFIEGRTQTQEEFFHIFNTLHIAQKQIVLTSDRHPQALPGLEERLRSRFEWGLMADVQPPSLETRVAILRRKVMAENLTATNEVLEFIATRIKSNIRELEGALIRVTAYASLQNQILDLPLAEHVLEDLIPMDSMSVITPELIQAQVADYYQLSVDSLTGPERTQSLATARQVAMYLCRELTSLSLPKIGDSFGGRDHTTVMHGERRIKALMRERRDLFDQVTELTNRIRAAAR
ncbi:MAG: chromosomal replication initiator protein DnaA [Propionibacteriaceae bacterium]|nr:chromosomal replication initiator protein DnaA [Propionibacteriaceae bacterium]